MDLKEYVKNRLEEDMRSNKRDKAHDMKHVLAVYNYAKKLCEKEGGDWEVIGPAVLLHDIERPLENYMQKDVDHAELSARTAEKLGYNERVCNAIRRHAAGEGLKPAELEDKILWDADKLEAFGPVGLSRWYVLSGQNDRTYLEATEDYIKVVEKIGLKKCSFSDTQGVLDAWFFTDTAKELGRPWLEYTQEFVRKVLG